MAIGVIARLRYPLLSVSPRCGAGADLEPGSASRLGKLTNVGGI
jgi:hypothetical protein